jgi:hypothetical protein
MNESGALRPVATLWQLTFNDQRLCCNIYRDGQALQLRVESPSAVILNEPFDLMPRMLARTQALRASLVRRGWRES